MSRNKYAMQHGLLMHGIKGLYQDGKPCEIAIYPKDWGRILLCVALPDAFG